MSDKVQPSRWIKRQFRKAKKANTNLSLKQFARSLGEDAYVDSWFFNKSSKVNKEAKALRLKTKGARIAAEKASKKQRKSK